MAEPETTTPLFVASMSSLKASLRLSGMASTDALAMLNDAVEEVRVLLYDALGSARIASLKAITYALNPETDSEALRAKANHTEVKWVRLLLLQRLPTLFNDSNQATQQWNQEGLPRETSSRQRDVEINRLDTEIQDALVDLAGGSPSEGDIAVSVLEPDTQPFRPGDSLAGGSLYGE